MVAEPGPPLKAKVRGRFAPALSTRVGDVKHSRLSVALIVFDGEETGGGGVGESLAGEGDFVVGDDGFFFGGLGLGGFAGRFRRCGCGRFRGFRRRFAALLALREENGDG